MDTLHKSLRPPPPHPNEGKGEKSMNEDEMTVEEWNEANAVLISMEGRKRSALKRCEYCGVDTERSGLFWVATRHLTFPYLRHEQWCLPCGQKGQGGNTEQFLARFPIGYEIAEKVSPRQMLGLADSMPFLSWQEPVW